MNEEELQIPDDEIQIMIIQKQEIEKTLKDKREQLQNFLMEQERQIKVLEEKQHQIAQCLTGKL